MNEIDGRVLGYLAYKNKMRFAEWTERLWRRHLAGEPRDVRPDEDRARYLALIARAEDSRSVARRLHARRSIHAPPFAQVEKFILQRES